MWFYFGEVEMNIFFWKRQVSVNNSQLCILMKFCFHFIPRIDRLVSKFLFFKGLNANLIYTFKRDLGRGGGTAREAWRVLRRK